MKTLDSLLPADAQVLAILRVDSEGAAAAARTDNCFLVNPSRVAAAAGLPAHVVRASLDRLVNFGLITHQTIYPDAHKIRLIEDPE